MRRRKRKRSKRSIPSIEQSAAYRQTWRVRNRVCGNARRVWLLSTLQEICSLKKKIDLGVSPHVTHALHTDHSLHPPHPASGQRHHLVPAESQEYIGVLDAAKPSQATPLARAVIKPRLTPCSVLGCRSSCRSSCPASSRIQCGGRPVAHEGVMVGASPEYRC